MFYVDVSHVSVGLPDGRMLLDDVSFRVADGAVAALVGANGAGKSTILRVIAGDQKPTSGSAASYGGINGGLGVMRQFIGSVDDDTTVREFLLGLAAPHVRAAGERLEAAEWALAEQDDEPRQMRYAEALAAWGDNGGYAYEVLWDTVTVAALGLPLERAQHRMVRTLSGGEQKRLALEALLRDDWCGVLLLDEPDNYLDVPGKRWLEEQLRATWKTVLFVSHDRELLARAADRIVTIEARGAWVHGGGFTNYHESRAARLDRLDELHRRWDEEHERLRELVKTLQQQAMRSDAMASRYKAMQTRLAKFEAAGPPPERPKEQQITMRLRGGRTGVRAFRCAGLELRTAEAALTKPFDLELFYGERVAILGPNGTGKSHFLRLLAGEQVVHSGQWQLGARVVPGMFAQTHEHPELAGRTLVQILGRGDDMRSGVDRGRAMAALRRYELTEQADQSFDTLSGGQQARLQILLLELSGATMLLLDEPTDNLDVVSAEALEEGLGSYDGTVLAVTHDRWFARSFDRFVIFRADGTVVESPEPVWDADQGARPAKVRASVL
jgi:ATPase subunit of ABC transporter with duplicated ATPase domains